MGVFPVVFDATPSYLGGSLNRSLLLAPVGSGSLLCHLHSRLTSDGPYKLTVVPAFEPDSEYCAALSRTCGELERVVRTTDFADFVASLEPSDSLLMIDPRHVMEEGLNPSLLLDRAREAPGTVLHLTALDANIGGTSEWVDVDAHGQISRVQRYYDDLTWSYAVGIAASLVPVWSLKTMRMERFTSLLSLRSALSAAGIPCRDVPLGGRAFDLSHEREFLMLTESIVRGMDRESAAVSKVGSAARIDKSARIVGSVVVQSGAQIERNATVIGPAVIGAGATVGSGALVVQCVVNKEVRIPPGSVVRHRLVSDAPHDPPIAQGPPAYDPLAVRGFRSGVRDEKPTARIYPDIKLIVESAMATLGLIALSPLMAIVAMLIKLESRGPVLFIDRREARGRKTFDCFKFRTMRTGADRAAARAAGAERGRRPAVQAGEGSAGDPRRAVDSAVQPRRAAAADQRHARPDEPGRPAAVAVPREPDVRALARRPPLGATWHHGTLAGLPSRSGRRATSTSGFITTCSTSSTCRAGGSEDRRSQQSSRSEASGASR